MTDPTLYIVSDGKPGHLAQTRGLAEAIGRSVPAEVVEHQVGTAPVAKRSDQDATGLVVCAGRATYSQALRLGKQLALPSVALMNPGWWLRRRFDLCVIPRHDGVTESGRVIVTEGALNGVRPAEHVDPNHTLVLIGGPSKHHEWDSVAIERQLVTLIERQPAMRFTATGSRRTPDATDQLLHGLADRFDGRFVYTPASQTPRGWVAEQLARCGVCWVSEDSVSMVYESLTAGARVGLLDVPRRSARPGRVVRGVVSLVERGWVLPFVRWRNGEALPCDRPALAEADRVASLIIKRWLKLPAND